MSRETKLSKNLFIPNTRPRDYAHPRPHISLLTLFFPLALPSPSPLQPWYSPQPRVSPPDRGEQHAHSQIYTITSHPVFGVRSFANHLLINAFLSTAFPFCLHPDHIISPDLESSRAISPYYHKALATNTLPSYLREIPASKTANK